MVFRIPGLWTLTTTSSSSASRASWTCPREAEATGVSSKFLKMSSREAPSSVSIIFFAWPNSNGGTLSCSFPSSRMNSTGNRSGRVERIWPILIKVGPRSSKAILTLSARVSFSIFSRRFLDTIWRPISMYCSIFRTSTRSPKPYLKRTVRIWR